MLERAIQTAALVAAVAATNPDACSTKAPETTQSSNTQVKGNNQCGGELNAININGSEFTIAKGGITGGHQCVDMFTDPNNAAGTTITNNFAIGETASKMCVSGGDVKIRGYGVINVSQGGDIANVKATQKAVDKLLTAGLPNNGWCSRVPSY